MAAKHLGKLKRFLKSSSLHLAKWNSANARIERKFEHLKNLLEQIESVEATLAGNDPLCESFPALGHMTVQRLREDVEASLLDVDKGMKGLAGTATVFQNQNAQVQAILSTALQLLSPKTDKLYVGSAATFSIAEQVGWIGDLASVCTQQLVFKEDLILSLKETPFSSSDVQSVCERWDCTAEHLDFDTCLKDVEFLLQYTCEQLDQGG